MKTTNSSYTSFDNILLQIPRLSLHVKNLTNYLAHLPSEASPESVKPEKLEDHIELVNQSALILIAVQGLEPIIDKLIHGLSFNFDFSATASNFVKELFLGAIVFHDYGKLNENFQADGDKMNNPLFEKRSTPLETRHSILSAYLFLNHYLQKLKIQNFSDNEVEALGALVCCFADPILKHHSPILSISDLDQNTTKDLNRFLYAIGLSEPAHFWPAIKEKKTGFQNDLYSDQNAPDFFPLYALLKLNFSLLTAADYQATLSYNYGITLPGREANEFHGVVNHEKKAKWYEAFKDSAVYNRQAMGDAGTYSLKRISEHNTRNNENLNHLRSRMLAEVIINLRANNSSNLFYLKAPTGAGKTNISLAVAMELLRQNERLNKVFYVFPFTTLITQTYKAIMTTLNLSENDMVELHSKAYRAEKTGDDGSFGNSWRNHVDYLFCNFPIVLLSHIKFFDVLKGCRKESNYLLHRMANSVVIIDELQSYSPKFWNHINYFVTHYAKYFNIRFVVMSATLPEIGKLSTGDGVVEDQFVELLKEPEKYFNNPNFGNRVQFNLRLMNTEWSKRDDPTAALAKEVLAISGKYAEDHDGKVKAIIEFITKKSASAFLETIKTQSVFEEYKIMFLSGTILEPRRKEIVDRLKCETWLRKHPKILLICTQVVEAGVDIDMDIGFKDHALLDSDEQLAGRVNRNASKGESELYLFKLDQTGVVYRNDQRLKIQRNFTWIEKRNILENKDFAKFYDRVLDHYRADQQKTLSQWNSYHELLKKLSFPEIDKEFMLIEDNTQAVFIPLSIPVVGSADRATTEPEEACRQHTPQGATFTDREIEMLRNRKIVSKEAKMVSGAAVFRAYENICQNKTGDFAFDRESVKSFQSLLSKFTINVYPKVVTRLKEQEKSESSVRYGYLYFETYGNNDPNQLSYEYESGLSVPDALEYEIL